MQHTIPKETPEGRKVLRGWDASQIGDAWVDVGSHGIAFLLELEVSPTRLKYCWAYDDGRTGPENKFSDWVDELRNMIMEVPPFWARSDNHKTTNETHLCHCELNTIMWIGCQCGGQ